MELRQFSRTVILGKIFSPIYQRAARTMCKECEDFIRKDSKILDLGCGSGFVSSTIKNYFKAEIFGVDIEDLRAVKEFPFQIFDGRTLPFKENSFDVVFISYVLHHTKNQKELVAEAKRVTKDKIIIYEDLPEGIAGKLGNFLHQITSKFIFPSQDKLNFKTGQSWEELFGELKLKIICKKRSKTFFNLFYPRRAILFILEKD